MKLRSSNDQITLDVEPHPDVQAAQRRGDTVYLTASLDGKLSVPVDRDLNSGNELVITVAGADGQVLATAYAVVKAPKFVDIEIEELGTVGLERVHPFKIVQHERGAADA